MSKAKPAPAEPAAQPAAQPTHESQPQAGGSYLRQPDGSLVPADAPTEPAAKE